MVSKKYLVLSVCCLIAASVAFTAFWFTFKVGYIAMTLSFLGFSWISNELRKEL